METRPSRQHLPRVANDDDGSRWILWVGSTDGDELGLAHAAVAAQARVVAAANPCEAAESRGSGPWSSPLFIVLASDRPGRWTAADAVLLSRSWPLSPIVSVAASLVDGRRRSGPQLPGIDEVAWHHLGGRCNWWLAGLAHDRSAGLGLPTTARREERLLDSLAPLQGPASLARSSPLPPRDVSIAGPREEDVDSLADLLAAIGCTVAGRAVGRPSLEAASRTVIWDVGRLAASDLEWLRLLAANRPGVAIVLLESFPRGDAVAIALRAGVAAVLGRPVPLDVLAGTLLALDRYVG